MAADALAAVADGCADAWSSGPVQGYHHHGVVSLFSEVRFVSSQLTECTACYISALALTGLSLPEQVRDVRRAGQSA